MPSAESGSRSVIGIEGMSCRLPAAAKIATPQSDGISAVPLDRWDVELQPESVASGRFGGFIEGYAVFDAAAFGISPSEAAFMDPAQRVLLEVCLHSLFPQIKANRCIARRKLFAGHSKHTVK